MASYMELRGTTFNTFTIGKRGPRLNQQATTGLIIEAIDSTTVTTGGSIGLSAGSNTGTGAGGNIIIGGGDSATAGGGQITLQAGSGATAGAINLSAVNATAGGTVDLKFFELQANGFNSVGFKAPDAITTDTIWTLPVADGTSGQVLSTNGSGILSWQTASSFTPYEAFSDVSVGVTTTATAMNILNERFANPDYDLNGAGGVRVNPVGTNLYEVTYSVSTNSTNDTRDTVLCELYIDGVPYPNSQAFIYNRNVGNGEGSAHKTVLAEITSGSIVEVRVDQIPGNGCVTIAGQSNIVFKQQ